jgi:hypothetical protein
MQPKRLRNKPAWWKQDLFVALAVAIYLALGFGAVQIWSVLSHQADAFAGTPIGLPK